MAGRFSIWASLFGGCRPNAPHRKKGKPGGKGAEQP